jgi:hypothetical protein
MINAFYEGPYFGTFLLFKKGYLDEVKKEYILKNIETKPAVDREVIGCYVQTVPGHIVSSDRVMIGYF